MLSEIWIDNLNSICNPYSLTGVVDKLRIQSFDSFGFPNVYVEKDLSKNINNSSILKIFADNNENIL